MSIFSSYKKIFLLGFIIVILISIPFSVYIAQKRQNISSKATPSTTLSFKPDVSAVKVGEVLTLSIWLDPGTGSTGNQVSFVKLSISFDPTKFTTITDSLKRVEGLPNTLTVPIDEAQYDNTTGKATLSLSIGADPTRTVTTKTKIATLQLKATNTTTPTTPNITFDPNPDTQVLSIASSDQTSENVLSTTIPATITITSASTDTTSTSTPTPTGTLPTTSLPLSASASFPVSKGGSFSSLSLDPTCLSLEVNGSTNGIAPYPLVFTVVGSDSDGIISKISFNFGDSIEDLTVGGGIGTSSVNTQISHTYNTPGIYTAYAVLTDNNNNLSTQQANCAKTITVSSTDLSGSSQTNPTLPPAGDGRIIFGLGALGVIITIIGGALLFL